jgi:hypothetical protein
MAPRHQHPGFLVIVNTGLQCRPSIARAQFHHAPGKPRPRMPAGTAAAQSAPFFGLQPELWFFVTAGFQRLSTRPARTQRHRHSNNAQGIVVRRFVNAVSSTFRPPTGSTGISGELNLPMLSRPPEPASHGLNPPPDARRAGYTSSSGLNVQTG